MNIFSLLRVCLNAILLNKMRSALTALGIVIGVAAVVAMVGITQGARSSVQGQISALGDNVFMVFSGSFSSGGMRGGYGSRSTLSLEDVDAIKNQAKSVALVTPTARVNAQLIFGNLNWQSQLFGAWPEYVDVRRYEIVSGRMYSEVDERGAARVCVVGQTVVNNLFDGNDPVGNIIRIQRLPFEVIGVLGSKGQSAMGQDQDDIVLIPFATATKKFFGGQTRVNQIMGSAVSGDAVEQAKEEIGDVLRARHKLGANEDSDFVIRTQADISNAVNAASRTMTLLLGSVALVSLIVGGIGIMNIMLVSVTERTREIGVRRAVGARRRDILRQFLIEAVVLSSAGGIFGVGLGAAVILIISNTAKWAAEISPITAVLAVAFAGAVGIFFGYYPARKASRLDPIDALRYE